MKISNTCINPDDYLETESGRLWSTERGDIAWQKSYREFENVLKKKGELVKVYIVYGVQGSGKSHWVKHNINLLQQPAVIFDAALPATNHRKKVLDIARQYSHKITAVWIKVPLEVAFIRNKSRALDKRIPEKSILSVYQQLQAATLDEGFTELIIINE